MRQVAVQPEQNQGDQQQTQQYEATISPMVKSQQNEEKQQSPARKLFSLASQKTQDDQQNQSENQQQKKEENKNNNENNTQEQQQQLQQQSQQNNTQQENNQQEQQQQRIQIQNDELSNKVQKIIKELKKVQLSSKIVICYKFLLILIGIILYFTEEKGDFARLIILFVCIDLYDQIYQLYLHKISKTLQKNISNDHHLISEDEYSSIYLQSIKKENLWFNIEGTMLQKHSALFVLFNMYVIFYVILFFACVCYMFILEASQTQSVLVNIFLYIHLIFGLVIFFCFMYAFFCVLISPFRWLYNKMKKQQKSEQDNKANKQFLHNLKAKSYNILKKYDQIHSDECVICLENYKDNSSVILLECGQKNNHHFHKECLVEWMKGADQIRCPVCRHNFTEDQQHKH